MECKFFGQCGSCSLYGDYETQLKSKIEKITPFFKIEPQIFPSPSSHYRARGEFGIWHEGEKIFYTMYGVSQRRIKIDSCPMMLRSVSDIFISFKEAIEKEEFLLKKLFRIDFLSSLKGETLATLVYHRPLNKEWEEKAKELAKTFGIEVIGRSRGQKVVLGRDFIYEELPIFDKNFIYLNYEGSFTQPNPFINIKMIEWALKRSKNFGGDLLELYCGAGNFTLPLAQNFNKVLATEISKTSIKAAKEAMKLNNIENIEFVRMSSEEFCEALEQKRSFRRLRGMDLKSYNFSTVFVDPPRSGLDEATRALVSQFENIIYISCNPQTLLRDIEALKATHQVTELAFFDQFPYTPHLESGVVLRR